MYASRVDLTWAGWTQFGERRGQHGLSRTTATAAEASCPWCEATTSLLISSTKLSAQLTSSLHIVIMSLSATSLSAQLTISLFV